MSAGHQRGTKYSTEGLIWTSDMPITRHALNRYRERTPDDAVPPLRAWERGEDVQHPGVAETLSDYSPPVQVRVYNHNQEWFAVFIVVDDGYHYDEPYIKTVYNLFTLNHGPSRAYLHSHGPHYEEADAQ